MEPRERLKRYLEQRRELGERELVLDGMTVDDVMRIVGAMGTGSASLARPPRPKSPPAEAGAPSISPPSASASAQDTPADGPSHDLPGRTVAPSADIRPTRDDAPATTDWREALRASGVDPSSGEGKVRKSVKPADAGEEARGSAPPPRSVSDDAAPDRPTPRADTPGQRADPMMPSDAGDKPASKRYDFPRPSDLDPEPAVDSAGTPGSPRAGIRGAGRPTNGEPAAGAVAAPPAGLVVGGPARDLFVGDAAPPSLDRLAEVIRACTRCRLYSTATNPVPGEGDPNAELVCVGEAPGANEDATGRPFVGQAGQLLTKILAAINLRREDVFICNVLKHRPPGNRNPLPDEVAACSPYLVQQLEAIRPKVIVAFGTFAAQTLLNTKLPIGKLRGSVHRYYGIPLIVTYHPAALLRNPAWKRPTWEDVQLARRILDSAPRA